MKRDIIAISKIISEMLDNPNDYRTISIACAKLERYIEKERIQAIGWMHAEACAILDNGNDPRTTEVPEIILKASTDLNVIK